MTILLILLAIVSSSISQSIHHMMTTEELLRTFGTLLIDKVPPYDTIPIFIKNLNKNNNGMYISLKPFGENLKMWLTPKDGILVGEDMPLYSIKTNQNQSAVDVTKYSGFMASTLPKLYENTLHAATFAVNNHRDGKKSIRGFIGDSYIQPVPSRFIELIRRYAKAVNNTLLDHETDDRIYHFVHKILNLKIKRQGDPQFETRPANDPEKIIYPEILVIVDYDLTLKFNRRVKEALLYLLSFWNGVDMRYRSIEHPRVRLNIAGIVFPQDSTALSYLIKSNGIIKTSESLKYKGKFLYHLDKLIPFNSYDIAVTMTSNSMCDGNYCHVLGQVANIGKACDVNHKKRTMEKVLIMRDRGAFDGIETASHELGHLLAMHHDSSKNENCSNDSGYIMAKSNIFSKYAFEWSECSLDEMQTFLKTPKASCLFNKPNQGKPIHRFLPGQLMDADQQCKMLKALKADKIDDSICVQLKCQFPEGKVSKFTDLVPEAAEGTTCGVGKLCLHGKCVSKTLVN